MPVPGRALSSDAQIAEAHEALLTAEGSDWFWWFGPENSSANDAEFDAFFRQLLSEVYRALGSKRPTNCLSPSSARRSMGRSCRRPAS